MPACDREIISTRNTLLTNRMENEDDNERRSGEHGSHGGKGGKGGKGGQGGHSGSGEKGSSLGNWNPAALGSVQCNSGNQLPNVRLVSRTIHSDQNVPGNVNQFFPMFAQFLCHDFILTQTQAVVPDCCSPLGITDFTNCLPIIVPPGDSFFPAGTCLAFSRAVVYCNQTGSARRHINKLSAFIDAESVYGFDQATANALRSFTGGKLLETTPGRLLPRLGAANKFTAGDTRATENPALATVHTIFMREHNRIASQIAAANSTLSDNQVTHNKQQKGQP